MTDPFDEDVPSGTVALDAPELLRMTAPLRQAFAIPYHDLGPTDGEPRIVFVAGLHGNEINGVFVLSRLANFLSGVAAGRYPTHQLRQRVVIVPAVNVLGLNLGTREWPFDKTDINRMFPGYDAGETTQRIAHAVMELSGRAHYRVDIHGSNEDFEELPQVRLYDPSAAERETAWKFHLPAIVERRANKVFSVTMAHAWAERGGENFVVQAGRAGNLQPRHCETLFKSFVKFLGEIDVLTGADVASDEDTQHFGLDQTFPLISERAGIFVTKRAVGDWLLASAVIGFVYDGFTGQLLETVKAPVAGLLSGLRRRPLLYEGDLVARIQTRHPNKERAETYLSGQGQ